MSTTIIGRIDEMGNRIDDLEKSINDLMEQVRLSDTSLVSFVISLFRLVLMQMRHLKKVVELISEDCPRKLFYIV